MTVDNSRLGARDMLGYLLGSVMLALATFIPGHLLKHYQSDASTDALLWESCGVFIVSILACIRYGKKHLGSCIIAAIFGGPLVGLGLKWVSVFLSR